jgi:hypothetical protein
MVERLTESPVMRVRCVLTAILLEGEVGAFSEVIFE